MNTENIPTLVFVFWLETAALKVRRHIIMLQICLCSQRLGHSRQITAVNIPKLLSRMLIHLLWKNKFLIPLIQKCGLVWSSPVILTVLLSPVSKT